MADHTTLFVRISADERAILEDIVARNGLYSLGGALRQLAFRTTPDWRERDAVNAALEDIAGVHQAIRTLIYSDAIRDRGLIESDVYALERQVATLSRRVAALSAALRKRGG